MYKHDIMNQIIPSLSAGDKILIAPINDRTLTEFRPVVEASFPPKPYFSGWYDNILKHKSKVEDIDAQGAKLREKIRSQVTEVFAGNLSSQQTDIFSSLLITQRLFHNEQGRKVLVLMSDMIEDYPPYRFDNISWSPATNEELLAELEAKGLIADLSGVCVYVSGASASSAQLAENIGRFWEAYFRRARADMHPSRYAHVLLHWPPDKSCRYN